jgi:hypothetical protein
MISQHSCPELFDFQQWRQISEKRLYEIAKMLLIALGEKYRLTEVSAAASPDEVPYVHLLHTPTNVEFALIPGGSFTLGLSDRELKTLQEIKLRSEKFFEEWEQVVERRDEESATVLQERYATDWFPKPALIDEVLALVSYMQPAQPMQVPPFLLAIFTLSTDNLLEFIPAMSDSDRRLYNESNGDTLTYLFDSEIKQLGNRFGDFVLPSEAMWEYAYRAGSTSLFPWGDKLPEFDPEVDPRQRFPAPTNPNMWGLEYMGDHKELCADAWRASYNTDNHTPGDDNILRQVVRGGAIDYWPWQGCGEWKMWLSAYRNFIFLTGEDTSSNQAAIRPAIML